MIGNNYFSDNEDLMLYFNEMIDWQEVVTAYEGEDFADAKIYSETGNERFAFAPSNVEEAVEFYRATLDSVGDLAGNILSQRAQKMDWTGLKHSNGQVIFPEEMVDTYEKFREAGVIPYNIKREFGGLSCPATVNVIYNEILTRADTAFTMTLGLLNLAKIIVRFGTKEQSERIVTKMAAGEYTGAMALTEPNYGSDLSSVQTKAVKQDDGTYRITGTKRFISQGCGIGEHPCILLTMARTGSPESGARGLSLFIVKSSDVEIASIEKKMGIHCSPTCEVVYDNSPAEIIGEEGFGLTRYSMGMMNDARVTVAALGVGIACGSYFESKKYAAEREQFGKHIEDIPAVKRMIDRMEREIFAERLITGEAARAVDLYLHKQMRLEKAGKNDREIRNDPDIKFWDRIASLFTPLSKYYCSETSVGLASDALQIHGGAGYTEEYDVARIYRDSRINTIYEGTTQLQVVAAIGSITSGLSQKGNLRRYWEMEMERIGPNDAVKEQFSALEEAAQTFKSIEDSATRDGVAFEVVEICARAICGMLMERGVQRVSEPHKPRLRKLTNDYHLDTMATIQANMYRLKQVSRAPAAV